MSILLILIKEKIRTCLMVAHTHVTKYLDTKYLEETARFLGAKPVSHSAYVFLMTHDKYMPLRINLIP